MNSLCIATVKIDYKYFVDVTKLLEQRCMKKLNIQGSGFGPCINSKGLISALLKSSCHVNHEHSEIAELNFSMLRIDDDSWLDFLSFFREGHAHSVEKLVVQCPFIPKEGHQELIKVLDNKSCPNLRYLNLAYIWSCEDMKVFRGQKLLNLTQLYFGPHNLEDDCIPSLCEFLTDEKCNLTLLSLKNNPDLKDDGLVTLSNDALKHKDCKLENLNLYRCRFADYGVRKLWEALQNEHCQLIELDLGQNNLTDQCIPDLCNVLRSKSRLTVLSLMGNKGITNEGLRMLCELSLQKRALPPRAVELI